MDLVNAGHPTRVGKTIDISAHQTIRRGHPTRVGKTGLNNKLVFLHAGAPHSRGENTSRLWFAPTKTTTAGGNYTFEPYKPMCLTITTYCIFTII